MRATDGLEAVSGDRVLGVLGRRRGRWRERQRDRPVVRNADLLPRAVIKRRHRGVRRRRSRLGKGPLVATEPEVALDVGGMTEMETPIRKPLTQPRRCVALSLQQWSAGARAKRRGGNPGQRKRALAEHSAAGKSWHHILPFFIR